MLFRNLILPGVLIPSAVAAAVLLVAAWISRRRAGAGPSGSGLAVAAAFLSAFVAATGWPRWPPVGSSQKLFYLTVLAAILSVAVAVLRQRIAAWLAGGALLAGLLVSLLQPPLENTWSRGQAVLWLLGLWLAGLAVFGAWRASFRSPAEPGDLSSAAARAAVVGGSAFVLGLSKSALLAQLAGAVACGVVVVELAGRLFKRRRWQPADALVMAALLIGLLVIGHFYAGLEPLTATLLVLAYLLLALPGDRWWQRLAPLVPLAIAVAIVVAAALTEKDDPYDYYSAVPGHRQVSVPAGDDLSMARATRS